MGFILFFSWITFPFTVIDILSMCPLCWFQSDNCEQITKDHCLNHFVYLCVCYCFQTRYLKHISVQYISKLAHSILASSCRLKYLTSNLYTNVIFSEVHRWSISLWSIFLQRMQNLYSKNNNKYCCSFCMNKKCFWFFFCNQNWKEHTSIDCTLYASGLVNFF